MWKKGKEVGNVPRFVSWHFRAAPKVFYDIQSKNYITY